MQYIEDLPLPLQNWAPTNERMFTKIEVLLKKGGI